MKQKFYVVWVGRMPGIYESWEECKNEVDGFPEARYKGFASRDAAEAALRDGPEKYWGKKDQAYRTGTVYPDEVRKDSIVVDVACKGPKGPMEYRGIDLKTRKIIFEKGPFRAGTSNIGEFLAIVDAIRYIERTGSAHSTIYSDSKVAIGWVKNRACNTNLERTDSSADVLAMAAEAVSWLKANSYSCRIVKWETELWGEVPADYGRK
jgi:ribonuclease HI